jgi:hypothetical protein
VGVCAAMGKMWWVCVILGKMEGHFMLGTYRTATDGHADEGDTWKGVRRIADLRKCLWVCVDSGDGSKPRGMPFLLRLSIACPPNRCRGIAYFQLQDRGGGDPEGVSS